MKYDDASWHYGGDFPNDLDDIAGCTHIGMYVVWCLLNGMAGELFVEEIPESLDELKNREVTPGVWFSENCDEKFTDEDLNDQGNEFTEEYYNSEEPPYIEDYLGIFGEGLASLYHVPDTWESFDRLAPVLSKQFEYWKSK